MAYIQDGKTMFIESKQFKSGSNGEYPAMREASILYKGRQYL